MARLGAITKRNIFVVLRHGKKCVERYCAPVNNRIDNYSQSPLPILMTDNFLKEELVTVGELSDVWSQIVPKCLYVGGIGIPDIWWSVHYLQERSRSGANLVRKYWPG